MHVDTCTYCNLAIAKYRELVFIPTLGIQFETPTLVTRVEHQPTSQDETNHTVFIERAVSLTYIWDHVDVEEIIKTSLVEGLRPFGLTLTRFEKVS